MTAPSPTGLRERKKATTRRAISDVATGLFLQHGFEAVTLAQVAVAADVSVRTILNHFGSKEDLFLDRDAELRAHIVDAVVRRPAGVRVTQALATLLTEHRIPDGQGWAALHDPRGRAVFRRFLEVWDASPALRARHLAWNGELEAQLGAVIAAEQGLDAREEGVRTMAAMLAAAVALRHAVLAEWVLADAAPQEVERNVRAVAGEALRRVARAFPDLDRPAGAGGATAATP